jgi:hypothetical protein
MPLLRLLEEILIEKLSERKTKSILRNVTECRDRGFEKLHFMEEAEFGEFVSAAMQMALWE